MRCAWSRGGQSTRIGNSKFEIRVFLFSEVELRVLPILPLSRALKSRAMEMQPALLVFGDANVVAGEEVPALDAKARLTQGPPLLERIARLKQFELSAGSLG